MTESPNQDSSSGVDIEILREFRQESTGVLTELQTIIEKLEEPSSTFPALLMADFSQKIDRIMGTAKTIALAYPEHPGFPMIGKISELCKMLGYQAAEKGIPQMVPIFAAFWADTVDVMNQLMDALDNLDETKKIVASFSVVVQKRLEWLLGRLGTQKSSEEKSEEVKKLLSSLGL